jgi:hypothetical protein
VRASQRLTVLSPDPVHTLLVKGCQQTEFTLSTWPRNVCRHRPLRGWDKNKTNNSGRGRFKAEGRFFVVAVGEVERGGVKLEMPQQN